ncbi:hypothetical protein BDM02DRAFT_3141055 [Thelephora ganbajun]|uniref:Uncharacterized protein n=1 Tax=Thelephora ganbajun TaxID=370292 RepID=A0ACB6ZLW7_THEGA|nr:hypothetical protein BDM02DRAFT_3141055 [Thelephora ganbajun]
MPTNRSPLRLFNRDLHLFISRLSPNNLFLLEMPPRLRPTCQICQTLESRYNCPKCRIP